MLFALLSAFFHASRLAVTKHLSFSFSAQALTLYVNLASLVVTLPLVFWYHDFPLRQPAYVGALLCGGLLSGFGGWALNSAIQRGEISLVGPVLTLTPAFVVVIEWLLTAQLPSLQGALGLGLLMLGSYVLSLERGMRRWSEPLKMLLNNPGSLFTLAAALCFAAAASFGRVGIQLSDPLSFAVMVAIINPVILYVIFSMQNRNFRREAFSPELPRHGRSLLALGLLFALMRIADHIALSLTLASYVMAVKRTSGFFAVLLGHWIYDEGRLPAKLAGSTVMLLGLVVMTLM